MIYHGMDLEGFELITLCYMGWTLTIKPYIVIQNIFFHLLFHYRKFVYIPDYFGTFKKLQEYSWEYYK